MSGHLKSIAQQFTQARTAKFKNQLGRTMAALFFKRTKRLYREPAIESTGFVDKAIGLVKNVFSSLWLYIGLGVAALALFGMVALRGRGAEKDDAIEALTREARERAPEMAEAPKPAAPAEAGAAADNSAIATAFRPFPFRYVS